ncbi:MAG TPA: hypothetical protein VNZ57_05120 [Longimicrobiales bacterium]|nr:hypothetical protein [Longimicrobiales bacterium]
MHGRADYVDRRGFLRRTAGGTAAIALASAIPAGCSSDYPQHELDGVELHALSPREYAVARAAAEMLLIDLPVDPAAVARGIDRELAAVGNPILQDMKTVFTLLEYLTILGGRFRRFTALDPESRLAYFLSWSRSRFALRRAVFMATKSFVYFFAYTDPATRSITGFEGPWPERFSIPAYPVDFGEVV